MTDFMNTIQGRRSVRRYKETPVPEKDMDTILQAVRWSPSWANTQCWDIVVITDQSLKEHLKETISGRNPSSNAIVTAPVLLAVCGRLKSSGYYKGEVTTKFGDWFMFDLGIATQNLCLAAHALGLGTVVVGLFDHDRAREILKAPEGVEVVALIPLGYPDHAPTAPARREIKEFAHHNTF